MTRTKQRTSTDFLALTISANGGKEEDREHGTNYGYRVQVQSDATGARIFFDYHDSVANHDKGIDQLDREGLLYAFWAFVMDADMADRSFSEFASDLGYDHDSHSARRTYDACKRAAVKFARLWHDSRDPSWALEMLAHEGVE